MQLTLRTLIVEDNPADAELIVEHLQQAGYVLNWSRVKAEADFLAALDTSPDIILCDYSLPHFSGPRALALLKQGQLDIPFIIVSGTIDDEQAVSVMRAGADDYLLKDRLVRLGPAIESAVEKKRLRCAKQQIEARLQESNLQLQSFLENSPSVMFIKDTSGRYLQANQKFAEAFGLDPAQIIGKRDEEILDPLHAPQFQANDLAVLQAGKPLEFEEIAQYRDGLHTSIVTKFPLRDAQGNIYGLGGIATDITGRKLEEERFRATFEQAAMGIVHTSLDRRYLAVNQKFCDMVGYSRDELLGAETADIAHPDERVEDGAHRNRLLAGEINTYTAEKRYVRKDGSIFLAHRTVSLARDNAGQPMYFIRVIEDITARRRLEARMEQTLEQAAVGIVRVDLDGCIIEVNRKFCQLTGHDRNELLRMTIRQISHPDDLGQDIALRTQLLAGEIDHFRSEKRYLRKDGKIIWVRRTTSLVRDVVDDESHYIIVVEDITDRKTTEESYRATFDNAPVGIMHSTADRRILHVNNKLCEILGYTEKELLAMTVTDLWPPGHLESDRPRFLQQMLSGEMQTFSSERPLVRKDGVTIWTNRTISLVRDSAGQPLYFLRIIEDITERKHTESALQESERFAKSTIDALSKHICVIDETGTIIAVNKAWRDFGEANSPLATHHVANGANYLAVCEGATGENAAQGPEFAVGIRAVLRGEREEFTIEYPCHSSTEQRWFSGKVTPFQGAEPRRAVISHENITQRKLAENALKATQEKLQTAIKSANIGLWDWNLETNYVFYSQEWKSQIGYADNEIGDTLHEWERLVHKDDLHKTYALITKHLENPALNFEADFRMLHKDGSWRWMRSQGRLHPGIDGKPGRMIGAHLDITERMQAEQQIRRLNQLYSTLSQTNAAIVRVKNRDALFDQICRIAVEQNQFALTWIGLVEPSTGLIRPVASAGNANEYLKDLRLSTDAAIPEGHGTSSVAVRDRRTVVCNDIANDQTLAPWHVQVKAASICAVASLPLKTSGQVVGVLTFMAGETGFFDQDLIALLGEMAEDISYALDGLDLETKHRQTQQALVESDEKFREMARNIPQIFWMTDVAQKSTIFASPAYETISGRPVKELESEPQSWLKAVHDDDREQVKHARKERALFGTYNIEYRIVHTNGRIRWVHDRAFPVRNAQNKIYRIAGIAEDITERKLAEEQLANLAHYDSLTGLPNRVLFNDRLRQAVAQARRNHWIVGVLFLDLDRFKLVNDTLGHASGDLLLKQVAARLSACLRPTDTVGRLSGDEFAVILSELAEAQNAGYVAQKILDALAAPFDLEGSEVFVTASIGITLYPSDSESIDTLIRDADAAMYGAKAAGRNNYQYYTTAMNARATEKLQMETGIRRALERNELLLHYQPKVDIASGKVCGLEALLRWQSPEHGLVSPAQFIPLLEETGLIVPVGEWVTRAACAQLRAWRKAGIPVVPVAINLSARQLRQQGYARVLEQAMKDFDVNPELIRVEITESSLMDNPEEAIIVLQSLKALGIRLDADDFGTGYSSLSYLKRFPLDTLKIDRSFVRDITSDEDDAVIAQTVITLAHSLGLKVVAEGVETEAQLALLSAHHCDEAQGYLFAKPLDIDSCTALLATGLPPRCKQTVGDTERAPAVLLVDDDANDLELTRMLLQKDGHHTLTAASSQEAFKLLALKRVGVVISDQNMPGMSGVEFLKQVKLMYPDIVRVMLSGDGDFETATAAINEGQVHKFFVKGRDGELLRSEIKRKIWHAPDHYRPALNSVQRGQGRPRRRLTTD